MKGIGAALGVCGAGYFYFSRQNQLQSKPAATVAKRLASVNVSVDASKVNQLRQQNLQWQQTMLRIKDAQASLDFYTNPDTFDMKLIHKYHFKEYEFDLYFLATKDPSIKNYPKEDASYEETEQFLWNYPGVCLELTHNYNDPNTKDPNFLYNNGNAEPNRGFGHIAFDTNNVEEACETVDNTFKHLYETPDARPFNMWQKKLTDGNMKTLAFVKDMDNCMFKLWFSVPAFVRSFFLFRNNYSAELLSFFFVLFILARKLNKNQQDWIELINRGKPENGPQYPKNGPKFNFSQTMLRVKDPQKSLAFYRDLLGMKVIREKHFPQWKFSLYFLAQEDHVDNGQVQPIIELTHNHGTETNDQFWYHNGNDKPQGFGHVGFLCDDLDKTCQLLQESNIEFKKKPTDGKMRGIAFAVDPDGYWVELIQRGLHIPDAKFE